jgi:hypothetical protein
MGVFPSCNRKKAAERLVVRSIPHSTFGSNLVNAANGDIIKIERVSYFDLVRAADVGTVFQKEVHSEIVALLCGQV